MVNRAKNLFNLMVISENQAHSLHSKQTVNNQINQQHNNGPRLEWQNWDLTITLQSYTFATAIIGKILSTQSAGWVIVTILQPLEIRLNNTLQQTHIDNHSSNAKVKKIHNKQSSRLISHNNKIHYYTKTALSELNHSYSPVHQSVLFYSHQGSYCACIYTEEAATLSSSGQLSDLLLGTSHLTQLIKAVYIRVCQKTNSKIWNLNTSHRESYIKSSFKLDLIKNLTW